MLFHIETNNIPFGITKVNKVIFFVLCIIITNAPTN